MKRIEPELRRLIRVEGAKLKPLSKQARMSYYRLFRWYTGRTLTLDVNAAERLWKALTGRNLLD